MQGRLSKPLNGFIQRFPKSTWLDEFSLAPSLGLNSIEWTIDLEGFEDHPLVAGIPKHDLPKLLVDEGFSHNTVTCDFFMQYDPWVSQESLLELELLLNKLVRSPVLEPTATLVIPLVDQGSPKSQDDWSRLLGLLKDFSPILKSKNMRVAFEFDIEPREQMEFLSALPSDQYGVNFDTGNSASLGFDPLEEIKLIQSRLFNVHIKDRIYKGTSVPLGTGNTNFKVIASCLKKVNYDGKKILQGARIPDQSELDTIRQYIHFCREYELI
jgi:L-ribulose-5-phosphate 3-epimerase